MMGPSEYRSVQKVLMPKATMAAPAGNQARLMSRLGSSLLDVTALGCAGFA